MIASERRRQIDELGFDAIHDDKYKNGELYLAAWCYFTNATSHLPMQGNMPKRWPWRAKFWKPKGPYRDLIRAGALYLAERDRRLRTGDFAIERTLEDIEQRIKRTGDALTLYERESLFGKVDYRERVLVTVRAPGHPAFSLITYGAGTSHYDRSAMVERLAVIGITASRQDITVEAMPTGYK